MSKHSSNESSITALFSDEPLVIKENDTQGPAVKNPPQEVPHINTPVNEEASQIAVDLFKKAMLEIQDLRDDFECLTEELEADIEELKANTRENEEDIAGLYTELDDLERKFAGGNLSTPELTATEDLGPSKFLSATEKLSTFVNNLESLISAQSQKIEEQSALIERQNASLESFEKNLRGEIERA